MTEVVGSELHGRVVDSRIPGVHTKWMWPVVIVETVSAMTTPSAGLGVKFSLRDQQQDPAWSRRGAKGLTPRWPFP
jgi:hypothetical protein